MASDQAETYLRLMAETELRHALALPKVHQPRRRDAILRFASRRLGLSWHRGGRIRRATATITARTQPMRARRYAHRTIVSWRHRPGGAYDGLRRLAAAANTLVAVNAVDEDVAATIIADHSLALVLRQRMHPNQPGLPARRAQRSGPPSGPFGVVGIGARTPLEGEGEITLLALVLGPDRAVLTFAARQPDNPGDEDTWFRSLNAAKIIDSSGSGYRLAFSGGGGGGGEWVGFLHLHPVPAGGQRWIDLTFRPGTPPIRIDLTQARPPESVPIEPMPEDGIAERYVDMVAERLFADREWHGPRFADVTTLIGAGVITTANPAIARLVTLARQLDAEVPSSLAAAPDAELPQRWRSMLETLDVEDGPSGIVGAAAVLPELDGHRWAIAGLRSNPRSAELRVLGWGAQRRIWHHHEWMSGNFSWWGRDSAGRWHATSMTSGSWDDDRADLALKLTPALHPDATSIDVIITGKSGQITFGVPLDWEKT